MAPRILVLSASVGAGHLRAAQAVERALRQTVPHATVENHDVLQLTNAAFRRLYGKAYLDLVNRAPHVLGYFYDLLDQPSRSGRNRGDRLRLLVEKLNLRNFTRLLEEQSWDLAINTHFLPAEIIASMRTRGRLTLPQVTVTTDFETHRLWVNQPCDHYFTATLEGSLYLQSWGVPAQDTTPSGIPIDPVFATPKDRATLLAKHDLADDRPIILQLAGGFGVGPIEKIFQALLTIKKPLQLVLVAGKNTKVKEDIEKLSLPARHRVRILGYTHDMDELLSLATLVVTKPGGLTTSETLACGAIMVIVNPIPGQESRNSDFLLENGAAMKANNLVTLSHKVSALLEDPDRMKQMRKNIACLARPKSAFSVVEKALTFIRRPK